MQAKYLQKDLLLIIALFIVFAGIFTAVYIMDQKTGNLGVISQQLFDFVTK